MLTDDGSTDDTTVPPRSGLLDTMQIASAVITADARHCQRETTTHSTVTTRSAGTFLP